MRSVRAPLALAAIALAAAAGCGQSEPPAPGAAGTVQVTATDAECKLSHTEVPAGVTSFTVTNQGTKVTEFYVYGAGDRVMGEVENVGPGVSRELHVELPAGTYQTACKPGMSGAGIRGPFTVTGSAAALSDDARLAEATASYQRYVKSQTDALLARTQEFVTAVKAGDIAKANAEKLTPLQLANGAKELLDEVATGKITGEEDRYSHTDLWDFSANVEGCRAAVAALRPVLTERAATLVTELDQRFANVERVLGQHRAGDGWKLHTELSQAQLKELSDAVNALGESVSRVAAAVRQS